MPWNTFPGELVGDDDKGMVRPLTAPDALARSLGLRTLPDKEILPGFGWLDLDDMTEKSEVSKSGGEGGEAMMVVV